MTARIEKAGRGGSVAIRLIGRLQSQHLEDLKALIADRAAQVTLDLGEVRLVDIEVVRFLIFCEAHGIKVLNCPRFIEEWMACERSNEK